MNLTDRLVTRNPSLSSAMSSQSAESFGMKRSWEKSVKGVLYTSIFKAINNFQGTLCTYMVMKVMASESQAKGAG